MLTFTFQSMLFPIIPDEDEETNPGIYGKALAQWLFENLHEYSITPIEIITEDFGWCILVKDDTYSLYITCTNEEEETDQWAIFAFIEGGGLIKRFFDKTRKKQKIEHLMKAVNLCLQSEPEIHHLKEELRG